MFITTSVDSALNIELFLEFFKSLFYRLYSIGDFEKQVLIGEDDANHREDR